jgi:hypothetical protein
VDETGMWEEGAKRWREDSDDAAAVEECETSEDR